VNIKVTLEFNSWAEAVAYMGAGDKKLDEKKSVQAPAPAASPAIATQEKAPAAPKQTDAAPSQSAAPADSDAQASTAASEPTYTEVADAINKAVPVARPHVVATLQKFGAKNGQGLKPEQYSDFLKALADR